MYPSEIFVNIIFLYTFMLLAFTIIHAHMNIFMNSHEHIQAASINSGCATRISIMTFIIPYVYIYIYIYIYTLVMKNA